MTLGSAQPVQTSIHSEDRNGGPGEGEATDLAVDTAIIGIVGDDSAGGGNTAARQRIAELEAKCKNLEAQVRSIEQQGSSSK